jgi:hypothetical protein
MTISKEERAELRANIRVHGYPYASCELKSLLDALDASDERIAGLEALRDAHRDARERADAREDALKARIAELEAAAQWRPMDTAPRDGTKILVAGRGPDGEDCEAIEWTDEARLVLEEEFSGHPEVVMRWLPIPALPEGGAK